MTRSVDSSKSLVLTLGRLLHRYGAPAHRLEAVLTHVAQRLGLRGQFFSTPTELLVSFGEDDRQQTHLLRVEPGEDDLSKLEAVDAVTRALDDGRSPTSALLELRLIEQAPPRFGVVRVVLCFALVSGTAAHLFGGTIVEDMIAVGLGLFIGLFNAAVQRHPSLARVFELLAAMSAGLVASVLEAQIAGVRWFIPTLAGIIVLVPGLTLTVALSELASRHWGSGTSRMMGAVVVFLQIAVGLGVARAIAPHLTAAAPWLHVEPLTLPALADPIVLALIALGLVVLFQAPPTRLPWIVATCAVAFYGSRVGAAWLGPELGAGFGAFAVTLASNAYARWVDRPASVTLVPAILLLVPGSTGMHGISSFLEQQTLSGVEAVVSMLIIAVAIVTGMHAANAIVHARRAL